MSENKSRWYVAHTYSGYENKVKANIEKTIENRGLHDLIHEIVVPVEELEETTQNGKVKKTLRKIFPGYVMVKMIMTDESWYVVRNTRGVTGFVGPGSKPIPLTDEEVTAMGITDKIIDLEFEVGDSIRVISGPLENFVAVIQEINLEKQKVKVLVDMFGRETPAELDFNQIKQL